MVLGLVLVGAFEGVASAAGSDNRNPDAAARTGTTPAAAHVGTTAPASNSGLGKPAAAAAPHGVSQRSASNSSLGAANGGGATPNGNKGHIQIEGAPDCGSTPCGNDNDPHVPCTLTVQLFGYPSGTDSAVLTITGQAPSGGGTVATDSFTFAGASSPNGSILDTQRSYSFTGSQLAADGLTLQPQQGYHLRIQVSVNGQPAKTHVIWFQPCNTAPVVPGSSASALLPGDTTTANAGLTGVPLRLVRTAATEAPASAASNVPDAQTADSTPAASSAPDSQALDAAPATTAALATATPVRRARSHHSGLLAFTGADILIMLGAAAMILAIGMTFVSLSRRRRARPVTV